MILMVIRQRPSGFTIVELLIVVVVIGVLVAIVIVTYSNVARQAQTSSLQSDVASMDMAQKRYMTISENPPIAYSPDGEPNDTLAFVASQGNSIVVKLKGASDYCIYGYNPRSFYPDVNHALVRASASGVTCESLSVPPPNATYSTVSLIGQRLEEYKSQFGHYPLVNELVDIGLVIKPNSGNANQQQLYCRNNTRAIYLQLDQDEDIVYVYETFTHAISEPTGLDKLSLNESCPHFGINPSDPGYESTGVKDPDL